MKSFVLFVLVFIAAICKTQAQGFSSSKPSVSIDEYFNWPRLGETFAISNDGKYVLFTIKNQPVGSTSLVVKSTDENYEQSIVGVTKAEFTEDSKRILFQQKDSLCLIELEAKKKEFLSPVQSYQLFMQGSNQWLGFQLKDADRQFILLNLRTGKRLMYKNVRSYVISENGRSIFLQMGSKTEGGKSNEIQLVNLVTNQVVEVYQGDEISNLLLNLPGTQLAFMCRDTTTDEKAVILYEVDGRKLRTLVTDSEAAIGKDLELSGLQAFSGDGKNLFLTLKKRTPIANDKNGLLNVWSFMDARLQQLQLQEMKAAIQKQLLAVLPIVNSNHLIQLQNEGESFWWDEKSSSNDYVLVTNNIGHIYESYWNKDAREQNYLVSLNDGSRKQVPLFRPAFSSAGKFLVGSNVDESNHDLFVYNLAAGTIINVTSRLPIPTPDNDYEMVKSNRDRSLQVVGWLKDDVTLIICDRYDLWMLDPLGKKDPIRLTHGRTEHWQFRVVAKHRDTEVIDPKKPMILGAFNTRTKQMGYYELALGKPLLKKLFVGDYWFTSDPHFPLKARDAEVYLVRRERSDESPNLFFTRDFREFQPVSNLNPENSVNWLRSELINYTTGNGIWTQAVVFKPENFNQGKKYPLILWYYEKKSDLLNQYPRPVSITGTDLDISWFVSHDYLVCLPDIHYKIGEPGESALKAVEGAAIYLSKRPYVDRKHIGIQGHSFGGYETNYILSHSRLFAAAISASGNSDLAMEFGSIWQVGAPKAEYLEMRDVRIGTTPWARPDLYMKNSPIYSVGKVTTPVMLVNNRKDNVVSFSQGLLFYIGLRRAGKRVWMLEYDNGDHGVFGEDHKDFLLRSNQFFDHYLKDSACPKWMLYGIPASDKGYDDGLELVREKDKNGHWLTPPEGGLLTPEEKKKVEALQHRKPITVTIE